MARKLLILSIVSLWCLPSLCINYMMPYVTPQSCKANQYFQFSSLRCQDCGSGQERSQDFLSCTCKVGYKTAENNGGPSDKIICEECDSSGSLNDTSSLDGSFCIKCPDTVGFNMKTGTCNSCPPNSFAIDRDQNGTRLQARQCVACDEDTTLSGEEKQACRRYHSSFLLGNSTIILECISTTRDSGYQVVGGICLKDEDLLPVDNKLYKVTYVDEDKPIDSSFYERNLRAAQALCKKDSNFTACQLFGNLCVLQDYSGEVCKQYKTLVTAPESKANVVNDNSDWPSYLPWLFYYEETAGKAPDVLDKEEITQTFERNEDINFILVVYTLNGSFVGYENGLDSLQICKDRPSKMVAASKFATTYRSSCSVAVDELKKVPMFLYDMFLVLENKLYPVPVLMENYLKDGKKVNEESDRAKWQLTRRFYVVDNQIGIRSGSEALQFIRYASKIEVNVRLRSSDGEIYPPMLRLKYEPLDLTDEDTAKSSQDMSFAITYEMDISKIKKDTEVCNFIIPTMIF